MDTTKMLMTWVALLALVLITPTSVGADLDDSNQSISGILAKYGLPKGLLPGSVKSYSLADDGDFHVELHNPCYVQFDYLVYYEKTVTGKLSYGKITDLSGIQAKQWFIWVDVTGIEVDFPSSDYIYLKVGIISKKIEISWFESVPTCMKFLGNEPCNEMEDAVAQRDVQ
uniref:TSA: Wollemia nobilis Ref_Wollemi_Transcript_8711_996 transcribed RNA sequence n=1 Tax=Wollemia nobilis TaxID=56998 RepID=A0A0C9QUH1_9CONI